MLGTPPGRRFYDAEDLLRHIQRDVNTLGSDSYSARKWALKRLSDLLIHTSQPPGVMNDLFPDLMKPLLKRIGDGHEACRDAALRLVRGRHRARPARTRSHRSILRFPAPSCCVSSPRSRTWPRRCRTFSPPSSTAFPTPTASTPK